jgi:Spy/CpxP family protein refolding chaperone
MKGIRMAVLGAALVFGVTTVASAQGGGGQARGGGRGGVARLMTDITVSQDVQTKIDTIAAKYMAQSRELMSAGGGAQMDDATRAKMAEINTKRNAEIRALLTPEQQVQFDKNVAAMPARGNRGGGGAGAGAPPPPPPPAL